jgi:IS1 family transposase
MLVDGNSLRATTRLCDVSINTVTKLLIDLGNAAIAYHDEHVVNIRACRVQFDEIWSFVGAKAKNVTPQKKQVGWGDTWTWTAIDADSKLFVSYLIGGRDAQWAKEFMLDCAARLRNRVQLTTDGHAAYLEAVEGAFGIDVDYAQLIKLYGETVEGQKRYSPAECLGVKKAKMVGNPDPCCISTSFVERQNLTMRMSMRRFTRLMNAFSKKIENHIYAVALHFLHYNFARIHKTLRVTPAMAAGISDHVWTLEEIVSLAN